MTALKRGQKGLFAEHYDFTVKCNHFFFYSFAIISVNSCVLAKKVLRKVTLTLVFVFAPPSSARFVPIS